MGCLGILGTSSLCLLAGGLAVLQGCASGPLLDGMTKRRPETRIISLKQSVCLLWPCRAVDGLMKDLPLKKLRNFGGKLGAELGEMQCTTAGQVWPLLHLHACHF